MERQDKWDRRYLALCDVVARWSEDPSTRVGAVLVVGGRIRGMGYNGFPAGEDDDPALYADRKYKYEHVVHAEINALEGVAPGVAQGGTMYINFPPCPDCAERMIQEGVARFVFRPIERRGRSAEWLREWDVRICATIDLATRSLIPVTILHP